MDARFALLLGCFVLSGFSALLYQTVWTRELSFVFGTSELAVAAVLAAYMGGLALGSAAAARFAPRLPRPIRAYGWIELGIALCALLVPTAIRAVDAIYAALLGGASDLPQADGASTLVQLAGAAAVVVPPTVLMGATLPLLSGWAVRVDRQLGSRVGSLYAMNTAGAIGGTVCAAFWLIPELGLERTTWVGAALNIAVFAFAALLARGAPPALATPETPRAEAADRSRWILPAIALSGAVSFSYEVLWTRLLGHVLGASLHAFATMLASFLLGIALGSAVAARIATTRARARLGFAVTQLGIALLSYAAFAQSERLPELAAWVGLRYEGSLASAAVAAAALLPITLCIGATFPFAVRILGAGAEQAARATARVYAWNTVGAIAGALGAGFVLLPALGFAGTLASGVAVSLALAATSALAATPRRTAVAALALVLGLGLVWLPPRDPWSLLRRSPLLDSGLFQGEMVYAAVGRSSTVTLIDQTINWRLSSNGLPEAAIERAGMVPAPASVSYWLGLLPSLVRPEIRELLVVGLGGGSGVESIPPSVTAIDVIELEPEVVAANRAIAAQRARDPLSDARVHVHIGDARGALRLTAKRYGAIVSQPSHPWTAGASHLYTREFFAQVRAHLEPDGVFVQWIAFPFLDAALLRSLAATLVDAFGHVQIYAPAGPALLFVASAEPFEGIAGAARAIASAPDAYARFGVYRIEDFASAWQVDEAGVRALAQGAPLVTDDDNQLAARAANLGRGALDIPTARELFAPGDPLREAPTGLDRDVLLRTIALRGDLPRAKSLVEPSDGAARERELGWLELADGKRRGAARRFTAARTLAPDDRAALVGLVASERAELRLGPVAEIREADLDAPTAAVLVGWRAESGALVAAIASRDEALAQIAPGDALFREASRLRAAWRLESGDAARRTEAVSIMERLLTYAAGPEDALLHARAAIEAGQIDAAWGSLERISALAPVGERGRDIARRALALVDRLPEDRASDLRDALLIRTGGLPAGVGDAPFTSR
jgi:spermidine synthase